MRKTIIASDGYGFAAEHPPAAKAWLDLAAISQVEMTSEDGDHPIERAFSGTARGVSSSGGWRAAATGPQTLHLRFDEPQKVRRVLLHFRDLERERTQEFCLHATLADGKTKELVRQQWSFSPGGSTDEQENYTVNLEDVVMLTLWIDPDRGRDRYVATLQGFRVEG